MKSPPRSHWLRFKGLVATCGSQTAQRGRFPRGQEVLWTEHVQVPVGGDTLTHWALNQTLSSPPSDFGSGHCSMWPQNAPH